MYFIKKLEYLADLSCGSDDVFCVFNEPVVVE